MLVKNDLFSYVREACTKNDLSSWVYDTHKGTPFLIVDGWSEARKIESYLRNNLPKEILDDITLRYGDYETDCINYCTDNEWGFYDEYTTCTDCGKVICTSPNSYSWMPNFYVGDGFIVCFKCFENYHDRYLESLINNPEICNQLMTDKQLENTGFKKYNTYPYKNGLYEGMNDNPKKIYERLKPQYNEIVFSQCVQGQFHIAFDVWVR